MSKTFTPEERTSFEMLAHAASMVSRLNPGISDEMIGKMVSDTMILMIEQGGEVDTASLATYADQQIEMMEIAREVLGVLSTQMERDDITLETTIKSLDLDDDDIGAILERLVEIFDMDRSEVDFPTAQTVADLVIQIANGDDGESDSDGECPCGNPHCGGSDKMFAGQDDAIEQVGVGLARVLAGENAPAFVYSVGMSEKGLYDLIFVGDCAPAASGYIGMFVSQQLDGKPLPIGLITPDDQRNEYEVPIWVIPADDKLSSHAFGVADRLERAGSSLPPKLAQVVMPDKSGRFPWEPGYDWIDQQASRPEGTGTA